MVQAPVAAASVALGTVPLDHTGGLEDLQMVREEVGGRPQPARKLGGRRVTDGQHVDHLQSCGIGERCVDRDPVPDRRRRGGRNLPLDDSLNIHYLKFD